MQARACPRYPPLLSVVVGVARRPVRRVSGLARGSWLVIGRLVFPAPDVIYEQQPKGRYPRNPVTRLASSWPF
ncbi:hypothetical protein E2C01_009804 [Portunus trituberculatus]|uniref:Uncharacterized protein n=1 Tax=Portunus trituberculatus TaxID=210409 RepID=A0A5B7D6Q5_PORTR|nr:hypothetical protein [Portunus trituberculatus]